MSNVLTVITRLRAAKGRDQALEALMREQAAAILAAEPGCTAYRLHRSTATPEQFVLYETYVDDAAFDLHRQSPLLASYRARREREALLDGPVEVEVFRSVTD